MSRGKLIVFTGPSGVGKGTLIKNFINDPKLNLIYSVSTTTRVKRAGEIEEKDYFFVTKREFKKRIKEKKFLEWAVFVNNYYGTEKAFVEEKLKEGKNVFLEIEVQGGTEVLEKFADQKDLVAIFVLPPSLKELEERLFKRSTDSKKAIKKRIKIAQKEIKNSDKYFYKVVNNDLKQAEKEIREILVGELNYD